MLKHRKTSAIADTADATLVQPTDWNNTHGHDAGSFDEPAGVEALVAELLFVDGQFLVDDPQRQLARHEPADQHAADLVALLSDPQVREARVAALREAIARHSWAGFAERLVGFFELVTRMPEVATSAVGADSAAADAAALSAVLSSRTWRATAPLRKLSRRRKP